MQLLNKSILIQPNKLTYPLGWCGHIPFVSWLIQEYRPDTIVELGTHSGNSYFGMCQSVLENSTGSKCYAVDTWQGDEHAGNYGSEVFDSVFSWNQQHYQEFSNLLRMTFEEATNYFADKSVNLLHIDGFHTYEAVKNDFETWFPKLSDSAIVLFHDINVKERGFGVWEYWDELKAQYTTFEFKHSHGLGVLFIGSVSLCVHEKLLKIGDVALTQSLFSRLGELVTLRESAHAHVQNIESNLYGVRNELIHMQNQYSSDLEEIQQELQNQYQISQELNAKNLMLEKMNYEYLHSNSWKITKPLRGISAFFQKNLNNKSALQKKKIKNNLRKIYYRLPNKLQDPVLRIAFKIRPSMFLNHPKFLRKNQISINNNIEQDLIDISSIEIKHVKNKKIAVHCHIFYADLIPEFVEQLGYMPYEFDIYISVPDNSTRDLCCDKFSKIKNAKNIVVDIVANRGRDIAPMFVNYGRFLKEYDYIAHVQSKKSLYNNGTTAGWREYLIQSLFGSRQNIQRIFTLLESESNIGIIYPQAFHALPYRAFTWLANQALGRQLCSQLGFLTPSGYFNFPAGSMFWAKSEAILPLFDLNFKLEDFPNEMGQTDGTLAHALERMLGVTPSALGFKHAIIKDNISPSWSSYRLDQQYLPRSMVSIQESLQDRQRKVIAFDIFDTLLVRPLLNPDHTKKIVHHLINPDLKILFTNYRHSAEVAARSLKDKDISIDDIYIEFAKQAHISIDTASVIKEVEIRVELNSVCARVDTVALFKYANKLGKRVVLISDMFLNRNTIEQMLLSNGIVGWDQIYLSSEVGVRKDEGKLYEWVLGEEKILGHEMIMIGDNERSDCQIPADSFNIHIVHMMRSIDMALNVPEYRKLLNSINWNENIHNELTMGLLITKNLNKIADFSVEDIQVYQNDGYAIGYNIVGPILASFCEWLHQKASKSQIKDLYFLAREGQLISKVYNLWTANSCNQIKSHYLVVSRRATTVPSIQSIDDVFEIASTSYSSNTLEMFLQERFGILLTTEDWHYINQKKLWLSTNEVLIVNGDIDELKNLLVYLYPKIQAEASLEKETLINYLEQEDFFNNEKKAVVDVGYSSTIQKALIKISSQKLDGYYLATTSKANQGLYPNAAYGCFVEKDINQFNDSCILSNSFFLEKLLSSDDAQVVKYIKVDNIKSKAQAIYKEKLDLEILNEKYRNEVQKGCFDFVNDALAIKNNLYPDFFPSLEVANELYSGLVSNSEGAKLLSSLVLDDDYCGRGLIS